MSVYPKSRKKIRSAASGMNTEQIQQVEAGIISGMALVPGIGTAGAGIAKVGSVAGKAITGDGTNVTRNIIGDSIDPFSKINAIASGNFKEAIPVLGSVMKSRRMKKMQADLVRKEQGIEMKNLNQKSREAFGQLTFEEGGEIPDLDVENGSVQEEAVVLGGKSHDDGGNSVIDATTGEKVAETEREELVFTKSQTETIEKHIAAYDQTRDEEHLLQLGEIVKDIVDNKMIDYSGKFKK